MSLKTKLILLSLLTLLLPWSAWKLLQELETVTCGCRRNSALLASRPHRWRTAIPLEYQQPN